MPLCLWRGWCGGVVVSVQSGVEDAGQADQLARGFQEWVAGAVT